MTQASEEEIMEVVSLIGEFGSLLWMTIHSATQKGADHTDRKKVEADWRMFGVKLARYAA